MTKYEIPVTPYPQSFSITINNVQYTLNLLWNEQSGTWTLDINSFNNTPILTALPLVANIDLLEPFAYLNFGGQLIVQTDGNLSQLPTYDNLGTLSHIYFIVP